MVNETARTEIIRPPIVIVGLHGWGAAFSQNINSRVSVAYDFPGAS